MVLASLMGGSLSLLAASIDFTKLPPPSDKTGLTYTNDIMPIFKAACFRCHAGARVRGGIHLDSLDGVLAGGEDGPILTVGDGTNSQLVIAISQLDPKSAMPPKRRPRRPGGGPGGPGGPPPTASATPDGGPGPGGPGGPPPGGPGPDGAMGTNGPAGGPPRRPFGPPMKPLTAEEVGLVRAWINEGAK